MRLSCLEPPFTVVLVQTPSGKEIGVPVASILIAASKIASGPVRSSKAAAICVPSGRMYGAGDGTKRRKGSAVSVGLMPAGLLPLESDNHAR